MPQEQMSTDHIHAPSQAPHEERPWNLVTRLCVSASGHNAGILASTYTASEVEDLKKSGSCVLLTVAYSCYAWFTVAERMLEGNPQLVFLPVIAGMAGGLIVLIIDRGLLYIVDACAPGLIRSITALALRCAIALVIGTMLSQATLPQILVKDLKASAVVLQLDRPPGPSTLEKKTEDTLREEIQGIQAAIKTAQARLAALGEEVAVQGKREAALRNEYYSARNNFRSKYGKDAPLPAFIVEKGKRYTAAQKKRQSGEVRLTKIREEVAQLEQSHLAASKQRTQYLMGVNERIRNEAATMKNAFTANSAVVIEHALKNPALAVKWAALSLFFMTLELLPFIIHGCMGTSLPGQHMQAKKRLDQARIKADTEAELMETKIRHEETKARTTAALGAIRSSELATAMLRNEQEMKRKLIPYQSLATALTAIKDNSARVHAFTVQARDQRSANLAVTAHDNAMDQVLDNLSGQEALGNANNLLNRGGVASTAQEGGLQ